MTDLGPYLATAALTAAGTLAAHLWTRRRWRRRLAEARAAHLLDRAAHRADRRRAAQQLANARDALAAAYDALIRQRRHHEADDAIAEAQLIVDLAYATHTEETP